MKKEVKTTLSDSVMEQVADLTELELIRKNIYYHRDGTVFHVPKDNITDLLTAQYSANEDLLEKGVITIDMLMDDVLANFGEDN